MGKAPPFERLVANAKTIAAIREAQELWSILFSSTRSLMRDLNAEDWANHSIQKRLHQEDRIVLRLNTETKEGYSFLLTRRVALFILAASEHLVEKQLEQSHDPVSAKAVADFERKELVDIAAHGPEFEPGESFPMGDSSILVLEVTCSFTKSDHASGEAIFLIDFVLGKTQNIQLKLPKPLLLALHLLLESLCDQASWGRATISNVATEVKAELDIAHLRSGTLH